MGALKKNESIDKGKLTLTQRIERIERILGVEDAK